MNATLENYPAVEMKASDADRDAVLSELSEHFQAGRLTAEEFDERAGQALAARTWGELRDLLRDLPSTLSGPQPIAAASSASLPERASKLAALAPVAVLPDYQNRGIGSRLIREGLAACERGGCGFVVLLGEPAFYRRFGFDRADRCGLGNEYGADEAFMVLELKGGALSGRNGVVRYGPEFREFSL